MKLWSVEHFCPHFFSRSALISTDLEKKWGQKCSTGQSFICTEVTSVSKKRLQNPYFNWSWKKPLTNATKILLIGDMNKHINTVHEAFQL